MQKAPKCSGGACCERLQVAVPLASQLLLGGCFLADDPLQECQALQAKCAHLPSKLLLSCQGEGKAVGNQWRFTKRVSGRSCLTHMLGRG